MEYYAGDNLIKIKIPKKSSLKKFIPDGYIYKSTTIKIDGKKKIEYITYSFDHDLGSEVLAFIKSKVYD